MTSFKKRSLLYTFQRSSIAVFSIILGILITRILGPEEYGRYVYFLSFVTLMVNFVNLGSYEGLSRFIPEYVDHKSKIALLIFTTKWSLFAWMGLVTILAVTKIFDFDIFPKVVQNAPLLFITLILITSINLLTEGFIRGVGNFNHIPIIDAIGRHFFKIIALGLSFFIVIDYKIIALTNIGTLCASLLIFILLIFRYSGNQLTYSRLSNEAKSDYSKVVLFIALGSIFGPLFPFINNTFINSFLTTEDIGIFNVGIRIPTMVNTLLFVPFQVPFMYKLAREKSIEKKKQIFIDSTIIVVFITGVVALITMAFSKEIISILYGNDFNKSASVLTLFSINIFLSGFFFLTATIFIIFNEPYWSIISNIISSTLLIVLNFFLVQPYGILGVTLSYLIINILKVLFSLLVQKYRLKIKYIFKMKEIMAVFVIAIIFILSFNFNIYTKVIIIVIYSLIGYHINKKRMYKYLVINKLKKEK